MLVTICFYSGFHFITCITTIDVSIYIDIIIATIDLIAIDFDISDVISIDIVCNTIIIHVDVMAVVLFDSHPRINISFEHRAMDIVDVHVLICGFVNVHVHVGS